MSEFKFGFASQVKRSFAEEMVSSLYGIDEEYDWDVVTYYYLRRGRECIIPEVGAELYPYVDVKGIWVWAAMIKQYSGTVLPHFHSFIMYGRHCVYCVSQNCCRCTLYHSAHRACLNYKWILRPHVPLNLWLTLKQLFRYSSCVFHSFFLWIISKHMYHCCRCPAPSTSLTTAPTYPRSPSGGISQIKTLTRTQRHSWKGWTCE